jgi:hypothetical protein
MTMSRYYRATETCACGGTLTTEAFLSVQLADRLREFRKAHEICRRPSSDDPQGAPSEASNVQRHEDPYAAGKDDHDDGARVPIETSRGPIVAPASTGGPSHPTGEGHEPPHFDGRPGPVDEAARLSDSRRTS